MRTFAIGDIHGRYDLLKELLRLLKKYHSLDLTKDMLVFTGDYIDRGPQSLDVLRTIRKLTEKHPENVIALAGNHEYLMLDYYKGCEKLLWLVNGGTATLESFEHKHPKKEIEWVKSLPLFFETEKYFFSHAPIPSDEYRSNRQKGSKEYSFNELVWSCPRSQRTEAEFARLHDGKIGVCGHIHALHAGIFDPRIYDHYIFLDSGCGCHSDAPLCAVNLDTKEVIYSVPLDRLRKVAYTLFNEDEWSVK